MSIASEWHDALLAAVAAYEETRGETPAVRVTLMPSQEQLLLHRAAAGPGESLVTLEPFPESEKEMVEREGSFSTPRVVLVHPNAIVRVELLYEVPGADVPMGFQPGGRSSPP
jgi:hypothetical protein